MGNRTLTSKIYTNSLERQHVQKKYADCSLSVFAKNKKQKRTLKYLSSGPLLQ